MSTKLQAMLMAKKQQSTLAVAVAIACKEKAVTQLTYNNKANSVNPDESKNTSMIITNQAPIASANTSKGTVKFSRYFDKFYYDSKYNEVRTSTHVINRDGFDVYNTFASLKITPEQVERFKDVSNAILEKMRVVEDITHIDIFSLEDQHALQDIKINWIEEYLVQSNLIFIDRRDNVIKFPIGFKTVIAKEAKPNKTDRSNNKIYEFKNQITGEYTKVYFYIVVPELDGKVTHMNLAHVQKIESSNVTELLSLLQKTNLEANYQLYGEQPRLTQTSNFSRKLNLSGGVETIPVSTFKPNIVTIKKVVEPISTEEVANEYTFNIHMVEGMLQMIVVKMEEADKIKRSYTADNFNGVLTQINNTRDLYLSKSKVNKYLFQALIYKYVFELYKTDTAKIFGIAGMKTASIDKLDTLYQIVIQRKKQTAEVNHTVKAFNDVIWLYKNTVPSIIKSMMEYSKMYGVSNVESSITNVIGVINNNQGNIMTTPGSEISLEYYNNAVKLFSMMEYQLE